MGRGVTSISGVDDLLLIARVKFGEDFNLSRFVRECLKAAIFDESPIIDPIAEAARQSAEKLILEQKRKENEISQKRVSELIELEQNQRNEKLFREKVKDVLTAEPAVYFNMLPECKSNETTHLFWSTKAEILSDICMFPVSIERIQKYVREEL